MQKKKFKVLLADDIIEPRDAVINEFKKFTESTGYEFQIDECESPDKAMSKLAETEKSNEYYDIQFIDIDFTHQAHRGGKRDSGFQIIRRAFDICPISKICTYSGQFGKADLSDEHQELVKKGLVVYTFDKKKKDSGIGDWFTKGITEIIAELKNEEYLFDIFNNHKSIKNWLSNSELSFQTKWEVSSNLDTILILFKTLDKISSEYIFYRLIIHLYHSSLLQILASSKPENEIRDNFDKNRANAENIIKPKKPFVWKEQNALSVIIAEGNSDYVRYGFKLNDYRNKSIHSEDVFNPDLSNVLFAGLTLSLYGSADKNKIEVLKIEECIKQQNKDKGRRDLESIIKFLKSNEIE